MELRGGTISTQKSVSKLIDDLASSTLAIPEIQRDVVWKADQVKALVDSVNEDYPCGSLILWQPRERDKSLVRSMIRPERLEQLKGALPQYFLLDGQQRLTALASLILDRAVLKTLLAEMEEEMPFIYANMKRFPREMDATTDRGSYKFPWVNDLFSDGFKDNHELQNRLDQDGFRNHVYSAFGNKPRLRPIR